MDISYINPQERDRLSIPTRAIRKGEIVYLISNGMAFINFYDNAGNKLLMNENNLDKINICYKV
jgi:hypothetical protein